MASKEGAPFEYGLPEDRQPALINQIARGFGAPHTPDEEIVAALRTEDMLSIAEQQPEPNHHVEAALRDAIDRGGGKITFAKFMNTSLYSEHGYYASGAASLGAGNDFETAPEMHPGFNYTIANFIDPLFRRFQNEVLAKWTGPGDPPRFTILEIGAGNGTMAKGILQKCREAYPDLYASSDYIIMEYASGMIERQRENLAGEQVQWVHADGTVFPMHDMYGAVLKYEVDDAHGLHRLIRRNGVVREKYVTYDENGFFEIEDTVSAEVDDPLYTDRVPEGIEVSAVPSMKRGQENIARGLAWGQVLSIDYATVDLAKNPDTFVPRVFYKGLRYEHREGRPIGGVEYALQHPGAVDITASVDYGQLRMFGEQAGMKTEYDDTQFAFLQLHGFEAEAKEVWDREVIQRGLLLPHPEAIWLRGAQMLLDRPTATFRNFRVLVQSRGM